MGQGFSSTSSSPASVITTRDYTKFSAYLDDQGLLVYEGEGATNRVQTIEVEVPQTDTRQNPNELPDALGKHYAGGDFSHGAGQLTLHKASSDPAKYNYAEGFDISEAGILRHHHAVLLNAMGALTAGSSGRQAQSGGALYVCDGTNLKRFASPSASPTTIDVHAGESAVAVQDVTAEGDRKFVALGANGIHLLDASDVDSHYSDALAIRVAFLKDRLIACTARILYEITASGAVTGMDKLTLKEGWTFTDLGENGEFVYATAINETAGLSKVYHFGLDSSLAFVAKGSTWMPNNELAYAFKGYLGIVLISCGRVNASGGKDQVYYKAVPDSEGFLSLDLVAEAEGAGSRDLASRGIATQGRNFLMGMTLGATAPYGVREGLAKYDPALDAFSHHLASSLVTATPDPVLSCSVFAGRVCFVTIDGLYYEDTATFVSQASMVASTGNWNNPGLKNWDESSISTSELPATSSVDVQYTLTNPEDGDWSLAGSHDTTGATEKTIRHPNLESADFTIKLISNATSSGSLAPEIKTFSVRSNPTAANTPYLVIATVRIADRDSLGANGEEIRQDPVEIKELIEGYHLEWFDWFTQDVPSGYHVRLKNFSYLQPAQPIYDTVPGENEKNVFILTLEMRGIRNS